MGPRMRAFGALARSLPAVGRWPHRAGGAGARPVPRSYL